MHSTAMTPMRIGLGDPFFDPNEYPAGDDFPNSPGGIYSGGSYPGGSYPGSTSPRDGQAPPWWALLGVPILQTTRDILAPVGSTQAAYGAQYSRTQQQQYYTPEQFALLVQRQQSAGTGIGSTIENFVRQNSTILLVGAGLFVLIQMPGFTRRGR